MSAIVAGTEPNRFAIIRFGSHVGGADSELLPWSLNRLARAAIATGLSGRSATVTRRNPTSSASCSLGRQFASFEVDPEIIGAPLLDSPQNAFALRRYAVRCAALGHAPIAESWEWAARRNRLPQPVSLLLHRCLAVWPREAGRRQIRISRASRFATALLGQLRHPGLASYRVG